MNHNLIDVTLVDIPHDPEFCAKKLSFWFDRNEDNFHIFFRNDVDRFQLSQLLGKLSDAIKRKGETHK